MHANEYSQLQLGQCIRHWRLQQQLSQESAAAMLGVAATTWSHWETGRRLPTPHLLLLLRDLTQIPIGVMLCENAANCPFAKRYLYSE
jgi:transcriptional regulator with XRE-family HTH domain